MPMFGLFVVRPPDGVATVTAIKSDRLTESAGTLRKMKMNGFFVHPLGQVKVDHDNRSGAQAALQVHIRTLFMRSPRLPALSVVW